MRGLVRTMSKRACRARAWRSAVLPVLAALLASCAPSQQTVVVEVTGIVTPHSFLANDLDFIRTDDPGTLACFAYEGRHRAEMPDKRHNTLFAEGVHVFRAWHDDGAVVEYWAHPDLGSEDEALETILPVAEAVGKLPTLMRGRLHHVVVHKGDNHAFSEHLGHFFVVYSEDVESLARDGDLEEQVFTASVFATLYQRFGNSPWWREAQYADAGGFITEAAARDPQVSDFSESALFAWTVLVHPGRLPDFVEQRVHETMPHRLDFFEDMYFFRPLFTPLGREPDC